MKRKPKKYITNWNDVPVLIDVPYVSMLLGMNPDTVKKHLREGKIKGHKVGNIWYVNKYDIMEHMGVSQEAEVCA